jgi:hypothetical protein
MTKKEKLANAVGIQPEEAEELFSEETLETMSTDSNVVESDDVQISPCYVYNAQCVSGCGGGSTTTSAPGGPTTTQKPSTTPPSGGNYVAGCGGNNYAAGCGSGSSNHVAGCGGSNYAAGCGG